jgi:hypothetical protein
MTTSKKIGIWMDSESAHLMELTPDPIQTTIIKSKFTHQEKEFTLSKSEKLMHNKEQHLQSDYYKRLGEVIKNYEEVLLFGPTNAKIELMNILEADHHFDKITIRVKPYDKMTENQKHAFVREYFQETTSD